MAAPGTGGGAGGLTMPPNSGGFPGSGGHGDSGTGGQSPSCTKPVQLSYTIPSTELAFVVGRNASMNLKFGDSGTRMSAVQADVSGLVYANQSMVDFGYQEFPSLTGCSNGMSCCPSSGNIQALPFTASAINAAVYRCNSNIAGCVADSDSRAISQTLDSIENLFGSDPTDTRYLVLLTDGPPGCPTEDPNAACGNAQAEVSKLTGAGIKTYVVAVGADAQDDPCLKQLANIGGTNKALFDAPDPPSLMNALNQISTVATITACTIQLRGKQDDSSLVAIYDAQGREIHFDLSGTTNGWNWAVGSNVRIVLHGDACDSLQNHPPGIMVSYGCPHCTVPSATCQ